MLVYVEHLYIINMNDQRTTFFPASSKRHLIHLEPLGKASQYQNATLFHTMPRQSENLGKRVSMRPPHMRDYTSHIAKGLTAHLTSSPGQCSNRCVSVHILVQCHPQHNNMLMLT